MIQLYEVQKICDLNKMGFSYVDICELNVLAHKRDNLRRKLEQGGLTERQETRYSNIMDRLKEITDRKNYLLDFNYTLGFRICKDFDKVGGVFMPIEIK